MFAINIPKKIPGGFVFTAGVISGYACKSADYSISPCVLDPTGIHNYRRFAKSSGYKIPEHKFLADAVLLLRASHFIHRHID